MAVGQAGHGHELLILGIEYVVIVQILDIEIRIKVGINLRETTVRQQAGVLGILNDAVVEFGILQSHGGIQITDVLIRGHFGVLLGCRGEAGLIKALQVLPKIQAHSHVLVLQDRIGADHGGTDVVFTQRLHVGGGHIGGYRIVDPLDASQGLSESFVGLLLCLGQIGRGRGQIDTQMDLGVIPVDEISRIMLELSSITKLVHPLGSATALQHLISLIHKRGKTNQQGVDELVLVGQEGLFMMHVQKLQRNDLVILGDRLNHIGVLGEVLDGFLGNISGKLDGEDLIHILDHDGGMADDQIQVGDGLLDPIDPLRVDVSMYGASLQRRRNVRSRYQHLCIGKCRALICQSSHCREHFISEFFIYVIQRKVLLFACF